MKPPIGGCLERKGIPGGTDAPLRPGMGGIVISGAVGGQGYVTWAELQPTQAMNAAGTLTANNKIDQALADLALWNANAGKYAGSNPGLVQESAKLRTMFGIQSPSWALSLGGASWLASDVGTGQSGQCGRFWTPAFRAAAALYLQALAAKYDNAPLLTEVVPAACVSIFDEPMLRQTLTPGQPALMLSLGYYAEPKGAQRQVRDGVLNGTTTLVSATAAFVAGAPPTGDVGCIVIGPGIPQGTTIVSRTNATTVIMSHAATKSATGQTVTIMGTGTVSDQSQQLDDISALGVYFTNTRVSYTFNPYQVVDGSGNPQDVAFTIIAIRHGFACWGSQFSAANNSLANEYLPPSTGDYQTMYVVMGQEAQKAGSVNSIQTGVIGKTTNLAAVIQYAGTGVWAGNVELPSGFTAQISASSALAALGNALPTISGGTTPGSVAPVGSEWFNVGVGTGATTLVLPGHSVTALNDVLVATISSSPSASTSNTVTDSNGNTWTRIAYDTSTAGFSNVELWRSTIATGKDGSIVITVRPTTNGGIIAIAREFNGLDATTNYNVWTPSTFGTLGPNHAQTPGAASAGALVFGVIGYHHGTVSITSGPTLSPAYSPVSSAFQQITGVNSAALQTIFDVDATAEQQEILATLSSAAAGVLLIVSFNASGTVTLTAPGQPTAVVGTPGNTQATVTFTAPYNGGSAITSTLIKTYLAGVYQAGLDQTISGTGTSKVVTGLSNGTAYTSSATCTNAINTGPESLQSPAYTPAASTSAPATPAAPTITLVTSTEVDLSIVAPSNGGSQITSYTLTPQIVGGAALSTITIADGPPPSTSGVLWNVLGLAAGTYTFSFTATNAINTSSPSPASAPVSVPFPTPPDIAHSYWTSVFGALTPKVLIGFQSNPSYAGIFVLGTSVLGGTDTLESFAMTDVSQYVTQTLTSARGRSRETDQYTAGQLTLILRNENRYFDPTNTASPYSPGIVPRAPVQVSIAGQVIFTGYADDFKVDYVNPSASTVTVPGSDGFGLLAMATVNNYTAIEETSGQRIADVLARGEVGYPGAANLATGQNTLQASTQTQVAALDLCQVAAQSEGGMLFCDRFDVLQFKDQTYVAAIPAIWPNGVVQFSDNASDLASGAVGYADIQMLSASTLLFNQVQGTRTGGLVQQVDQLSSEFQYLIRCLTLPSLECVDDPTVLTLCNLYLLRYAFPEVRFDTITIELVGLSPALQAAVASLDIGNAVQVTRTPPGGGSPIVQLAMIEAVNWSCDASQPSYRVTFGLMNISSQIYFILGSASQGVLGTNKIF